MPTDLRLGPYRIHRYHQDDLECDPIVCVHRRSPNVSERVFCLWTYGVQVGGRVVTAEQVTRRLMRSHLNAFAKWVVAKAKERGAINNYQAHELAGIIDMALWPERYRRGSAAGVRLADDAAKRVAN